MCAGKLRAGKIDKCTVHAFEIYTDPMGYNSGRIYKFRLSTEKAVDEYITFLRDAVVKSQDSFGMRGRLIRMQEFARNSINSPPVQTFVACCIFANFVQSILQVTEMHEFAPESQSDCR